jgi:hypothetical protein
MRSHLIILRHFKQNNDSCLYLHCVETFVPITCLLTLVYLLWKQIFNCLKEMTLSLPTSAFLKKEYQYYIFMRAQIETQFSFKNFLSNTINSA